MVRRARASEISATEREAIDTHTHFGQHFHSDADIDGIAAETVEFGQDQDVLRFQPIHQLGKSSALRNDGAAGNCLGDETARLDLEAGGCDFLKLL
ncbi:hypothetical protein ASE23_21615 [Rhizobium sp. Root73]|nr:hypothetical protein ASD36_27680 [Rhizobium sp. Root1334]KRC12559.1 hypothetical protein ASE23_21615 [Rhizobium sp. Root73]